MPILRAGPWGNLTDSFQNVPAATNVELDHYPVNIAKGNWPTQNWAAWYEVTAGCCTPASVDFSMQIEGISGTFLRGYEALDDQFGEAILVPLEDLYEPEQVELLACTSYGWVSDDGDYFANLYWASDGTDFGWYAEVFGDFGGWGVIFEGWDLPLSSNDECDPTGTYEDEFSGDIMTITNV